MEYLIEKICEPEVDKLDTHDKVDMIDKDVKINRSSLLQFCSGYALNIQGCFVFFLKFSFTVVSNFRVCCTKYYQRIIYKLVTGNLLFNTLANLVNITMGVSKNMMRTSNSQR